MFSKLQAIKWLPNTILNTWSYNFMHLNQHLQPMCFCRVIKPWRKFTKINPNLIVFSDFKLSLKEVEFIVLCNCCLCQVGCHRSIWGWKFILYFELISARWGKSRSLTLTPLYCLWFNHISASSAVPQTIAEFSIFQIQSIEKMREEKHVSWALGLVNNKLSLGSSYFQPRQLKMVGTYDCCS